MSKYGEFVSDMADKINDMEPLHRRFAAAAVGLVGGVAITSLGLVGLVAGLGTVFTAALAFSTASRRDAAENGKPSHAPEYYKNIGSMLLPYTFAILAFGGSSEPAQEPENITPQGALEQIEQKSAEVVTVGPTFKPA